MASNELLVLNFSSPMIKETIEAHLNEAIFADSFLSVFTFSLDWLNGKTNFEFQTSGSTGKPKILNVSKAQIVSSVESTASFFDLRKGDKVFLCLNTNYTGGKMMLARAIHLQLEVHIVLPTNLNIELRDSYKLASFVPNQLYSIFESKQCEKYLSNFENILIGGASVNNYLLEKIKRIKKTKMYETFGMTETLSHIALKLLNTENSSTIFEVLPKIEIKTDEFDCLMVISKVTNNEWIQTKDVIKLVDSHHFEWKGRLDNVVNSGGIKIYPEEVESLIAPILYSLNFNNHFFLTTIEDEKLGEKLVMVMEGEGFDTENLLQTLKQFLPKFHAPLATIFKTRFERTLSGKIIRK
jgi:O-succinylbenzoic acid--CoA ligase